MKRTQLFTTTAALTLGLAAAAQAQTLVYCLEGSPEGFDPAPYTAGTTFDASSHAVYDKLITFAPGSTDTVPGLAESWEVAEDGLSITFHLREGVKFQTTSYFTPTREMNADDVIFSFMRQIDKDHPWYAYAPGIAWEYADSTGMASGVSDIVRVDDHTVRFELTRPDVTLLSAIPMDFGSILSKEYADQLEEAGTMERLNTHPVGTGPFTFLDYQQDAVIRYETFQDYWNGAQPIDNLVMAITIDPGVRQQKLVAGECDIIPYPNPSDIASLQENSDLTVMQQEGFNVGYLAYNTQMEPFDNPDVRRALNMAINQDAIIDAVYQGTGEAAVSPLPPTSWAYNDDLPAHVYDPDTARQMLADAGVENLSMRIWAMPVQRPYNPNARRMAEMIQADFAAVGVEAEIISMEWGEYLSQSTAIDRDGAVLLGWTGDNADPDNFMGVLLSCDGVGTNNQAQWCYEPYDSLIQQARVTADQDERLELYRQAQEIFVDQAPWFTVANSIVTMPMRANIHGYHQDPLGMHRFLGVTKD